MIPIMTLPAHAALPRAEAVAESSETVYRAIAGKDALPAAASPPRYTETVLERLHEVLYWTFPRFAGGRTVFCLVCMICDVYLE